MIIIVSIYLYVCIYNIHTYLLYYKCINILIYCELKAKLTNSSGNVFHRHAVLLGQI